MWHIIVLYNYIDSEEAAQRFSTFIGNRHTFAFYMKFRDTSLLIPLSF